jgi:hypothetical protein
VELSFRLDENKADVAPTTSIVANLRELGYRHELQFIEDDFGERIIFDKQCVSVGLLGSGSHKVTRSALMFVFPGH